MPNDPAIDPYLEGVTVLDFSQYIAGPTCTRLLAEMGADVIKVERPPFGDPQRAAGSRRGKRSGAFVQQNRGKRSLCVDLSRPEGIALVHALVPHVDVVVENYSAGVMARLGIGYDHLAAINPRVIMASISGFGQTGPLAHKTAFDTIAQGFSGFMHMTGDPNGPPVPTGPALADGNAGVHAFAGLGFALYRRDRTGRGCHIDVSMVEALFHYQDQAVMAASMSPDYQAMRNGRHYASVSPAGSFQGPEGWIVILCTDRQIPSLWEAMERPDLGTDPRFSEFYARIENRDALTAEIESWMQTFATDAEVIAALEKTRVPCGHVINPADAHHHPFFQERRAVREVTDSHAGTMRIPGFPIKFSDAPPDQERRTPSLGEDNGDVLRDMLGYTDDQIAELVAGEIIISRDS